MRERASEGLGPALEHARRAVHAPDGDLAQAGERDELRPDRGAQIAVGADVDFAQGVGAHDGDK